MDVVAFLKARLAEDEAAAKDAMSGRWEVRGRSVYLADGPPSQNPVAPDAWDYAAHIARWDPARVLREVEAKRRILAAYERAPDWTGGEDVRALAAIYSDHPDYDPAWA